MMQLSGEEKGALLLRNLAPAVVSQVLARLGPEQSGRMRKLMARLGERRDLDGALDTLLLEVGNAIAQEKSAGDAAMKPLKKPAPPEKPITLPIPKKTVAEAYRPQAATADTREPATILSFPGATKATGPEALTALTHLPADLIATALEGESPRTAALLLNYFGVALAGDIFKRLPAPLRNDVSVLFNTQSMPAVEVLERIAEALLLKLEKTKNRPTFVEGAARIQKLADMLRGLDKSQRTKVLETIDSKDAALAAKIKQLLYRFDDVLRIESRSLQKVLGEVDTKTLAAALKGATDEIKDKLMASLSKRAQENLLEEIELSQNVAKDAIEQAENEIANVIQRLDLAGELVMID